MSALEYVHDMEPPAAAALGITRRRLKEWTAPQIADEARAKRNDLSSRLAKGKPISQPNGLISRKAKNVRIRQLQWVWPSRIACGKHTAIAGEPGIGKSQLLLMIAATITKGGAWPCSEGFAPKGSVIILSAEDDAEDTIVPRFLAAGGDPDKLHIVSAVKDDKGTRTFSLQADLARLEEKIRDVGDVVLVEIDPISSYLGKTDSHKNSETRGVIEPLSEMASRLGVAILSNTHFSKAGAAAKARALHRFIGSIAFVGAPRAAFAVVQDAMDEGRRLLLHVKNNLALPPQGLAYTLEAAAAGYDDDRQPIYASRVVWADEPVAMTADSAIAANEGSIRGGAGEREAPGRQAAGDVLEEILVAGPMGSAEVRRLMGLAGISWASARRSKDKLGVISTPEKSETGTIKGWQWALPQMLTSEPDAHTITCEHLDD